MPHIKLNPELPGIISLFDFDPETAQPMLLLAQTLLRGSSPLTQAEREAIAVRVSQTNNCTFCALSHYSALEALLEGNKEVSDLMVESRMNHLLRIAVYVTEKIKVPSSVINSAKEFGITDQEIHDTVAIAAAFNMYNRYVDGLDTLCSSNPNDYKEMGQRLAKEGYMPRITELA
jgi:uncharacterized peroxidase-related enzyme